ncbi:hypothetical protein FOC75_03360 [Bacillus cereus]|uniref:DUF1433 domain-containing protein n=4 Tax=Bacillus cereus group TaxID=86661 RepID=A0A0B5P014_BACTU|nr:MULTISPECIES: hypothetical protein [Bacillus cereus group]AJG77768.1 hypothetical protein BF38_2292 [Bacillus thuringiensis]AJH61954.1 hypothetical protein BG11_2639 [Bacillus cereus]AJK33751.1 hypothetical protein BF33_3227 [Bacillus cereus]AXO97223.1 hypothetical protein DY470_05640 [Bacillus anthracis]MCQ0954672.1 hypothetical protein [Bacillus cereus]
MKKYYLGLIIIFTIIFSGGCSMNTDKKNEEQKIVEKANETAIKYFKEKENLDVVITGYEFAPSDFQTVFIKGHVKDDKTQAFTVHVEYGDSDYRVTSRTYSESLE